MFRLSLSCAVPIFLAISGFFIAKRHLSTYSRCMEFWKRQIPKVYIPCLVFSVPWFIFYFSVPSNHDSIFGITKGIIYLFCGGFSVYYFIALIIQCYLVSPILVRYNNKVTLITVSAICVISSIITDMLKYHYGVFLPFVLAGNLFNLSIFFCIGLFLSKTNRDYTLWMPILMIILGFVIAVIDMNELYELTGVYQVGQKTSLYLYDAGVILLLMSRKTESIFKKTKVTSLILYVGEISFGVYFLHVYLIFILNNFNLGDNWFTSWITSTILTILIIIFMKRIAPKFSLKYLGFR